MDRLRTDRPIYLGNNVVDFFFYFSEHDRAVLARDKTVTFVLSTEKLNGTFAVGVVHDSPEYQHVKITQLLKRGNSGEHPRKKDFSRSEDPVFEVWTDRIKKEEVSYTGIFFFSNCIL